MIVHYVNKEHSNYPRSACNRLLGVKAKTDKKEETTCKYCLKNLQNKGIPLDVQHRRESFSKRLDKVNLRIKEKNHG